MKNSTKTLILGVAVLSVAGIAFATYSTSTRLIDGGSNGASYITYARDSGVDRYAYLVKNSGGTYSVYAEGTGITGAQLCSGSFEYVTRPAISRDGKVVTFWARYASGDYRAYAYDIDNSNLEMCSGAGTEIIYSPDVWPPQASNVDESGDFKVIYRNMSQQTAPFSGSCSDGNAYWKNGQLLMFLSGTSPSTNTIVSTNGSTSSTCPYLVTSSDNPFGPDHYAAGISSYTISSSGTKVTWAARAANSMDGVTENNQQIILRDISGGTRDLISKDSSGNEGNGFSDRHSMTGDGDKFAFESKASNLTSFTGDYNNMFDIFVRRRTANTTVSAYDLALNNNLHMQDGPSIDPVISGDGDYVAFESNCANLLTYYSTGGYSLGGVPFTFLADFPTSTGYGVVQLTSYKNGASSDWRTGIKPSINYDATVYGFHSMAGDIASPTQSNTAPDIYELN